MMGPSPNGAVASTPVVASTPEVAVAVVSEEPEVVEVAVAVGGATTVGVGATSPQPERTSIAAAITNAIYFLIEVLLLWYCGNSKGN
jgi:hypothetical protein